VLGDFQRYVFINGGWGELSLGQRTNFSTTTGTTAQPFGTALGGGFSGAAGRLRGAGFTATGALATTGNLQTRDVRAEGSVRYDSPNFSGFTFGASWKPQNNAGDTGGATSGHTNLGLNYAGGPLKVSYAYAKIKSDIATGAATAGTCPIGWVDNGASCDLDLDGNGAIGGGENVAYLVAGAAGAAAYTMNVKHNLLAANYTIGAATIYGGYTTSKGNTASAVENVNSASWNLAVKYAVAGNIDLMANYLKDNDKTAADANSKLFGLGADYKFSKRTAAYFRYENYDPSDKAANDKLKTYSLGLRHAF
jgi:predicted porin